MIVPRKIFTQVSFACEHVLCDYDILSCTDKCIELFMSVNSLVCQFKFTTLIVIKYFGKACLQSCTFKGDVMSATFLLKRKEMAMLFNILSLYVFIVEPYE